jgi:hypothetical protein
MKTLLLLFNLLLIPSIIFSQNIFYDALKLTESFKENNEFDSDDLPIFANYFDVGFSLTQANQTAFGFALNPYLQDNPFFYFTFSAGFQNSTGFQNSNNSTTKLHQINITTIADGFSQFLIERAKDELMIAYFSGFRQAFENQPEIQKLFPTTSTYVLTFDTYQYSTLLQALRDAFIEDLEQLPFNISRLGEIKKEPYTTFFSSNEGLLLLLGLDIVQDVSNGYNIASIISELGSHSHPILDKMTDDFTAIKNYLQLGKVLSESFRANDGNKIWVSTDEIFSLINDPVAFRIYLGLVYQQVGHIKIDDKSMQEKLRTWANDFNDLRSTFLQLSHVLSNIDEVYSTLKTLTNEGKKTDINTLRSLTSSITNLISEFNSAAEILSRVNTTEINNDIERLEWVLDKGFSIYENLQVQKYTAAVVDVSVLLKEIFIPQSKELIINKLSDQKVILDGLTIDEIITEKKKQLEKLSVTNPNFNIIKRQINLLETYLRLSDLNRKMIKYGTFISIIAEADSAHEVKEAIETVVLPVTSYRIKRTSKTSIDINSYVGVYGGLDVDTENYDRSFGFGPFVPIGPAFTFHTSNNGASLSLFLSLIDIGAIASFRLENTEEILPEFKLQNIVSPGVFYVHGIKKSPLSLHLGVQYGPNIRKIEDGVEASSYRIHAGISVDIPLLNLQAIPKD